MSGAPAQDGRRRQLELTPSLLRADLTWLRTVVSGHAQGGGDLGHGLAARTRSRTSSSRGESRDSRPAISSNWLVTSSHSWIIDARCCGSTTSSPARTCSMRLDQVVEGDLGGQHGLGAAGHEGHPDHPRGGRGEHDAARRAGGDALPGPTQVAGAVHVVEQQDQVVGAHQRAGPGSTLLGQPQAQRREVTTVQGRLHRLPQEGEPGSDVDRRATAVHGAPGRGMGLRHASSSQGRLRRCVMGSRRRGVPHTVTVPVSPSAATSWMCAELGTAHLSRPYHIWGRDPKIFLYASASRP